ncbi:ribonuclease P protein component [Buchnera aphidicola (Brachycaudus cardui)]|uniref:Ribonuclease P protein component n=1 Tax=Buchnera aphidicola (Brachycaudus cardui) TaxID=557993 RepID=A0A4D6Y213_9GAMM|nr:ribonuclease P protein component [Buchnera aphidicola]QCI20180.1 ribonuclease P protein component [Buchnera aphidicola (Brachycaudus cardui)]
MFDYFFKKKLRLSNSVNFQYVFSKSSKKNTLEISILGRSNVLGYPRLGLSIPRKNIKNAHNRNLIKRLVRETFRLLQHQLISMDFVVIAKKNILNLDNKKIIDMLKSLWAHYHR